LCFNWIINKLHKKNRIPKALNIYFKKVNIIVYNIEKMECYNEDINGYDRIG
jgi:hypothetical protein